MGTAHRAQDWLVAVQTHLLRGELDTAQATLTQALAEHPSSVDLRRAQAGLFQRIGRNADAEASLDELLKENPTDSASAFALAHMLKDQGRMAAAASALRTCFAEPSKCEDPNLAISAIELLDDCDRKADAAAIVEDAIAASPGDARLHAYAGMLQIQLGEFDCARQHYMFALEHDERAWEWHVPIGLSSAQRYATHEHPDLALFRNGLQCEHLSEKARVELHFALGKIHDDLGEYEQAARHFREGNALAHRLTGWTRKNWRRAVEARLASKPASHGLEASIEFTPVFIVGMPRSGTTLLAELLSRYPRVCSRGESPWIARLAEQPDLSGNPDREALRRAAKIYTAQSRQDDAEDAHWFIDKQPLNFRYIDMILAMFPQARIVHCQRSPRDTALSLWTQCFLEEVQGYSYDFGDIALVMRDCDRLMTHWRRRSPDSIHAVRYEELVRAPDLVTAALARWLGLPPSDEVPSTKPKSTISTASLWQARQPVNTRSVGRWKCHAPHMPELLDFSE